MHAHVIIVSILAALASACAQRIPKATGLAPGTPSVSWIIMSGDRDNPDQDFVCQSVPRNDCVVPVSRADAQVFSDVHVYYHGSGADTRYAGSMQIEFFRGAANARTVQTDITVPKTQSIANQSVTGIVTETPGNYTVSFQLVATSTDPAKSQPIREQVPIVVR